MTCLILIKMLIFKYCLTIFSFIIKSYTDYFVSLSLKYRIVACHLNIVTRNMGLNADGQLSQLQAILWAKRDTIKMHTPLHVTFKMSHVKITLISYAVFKNCILILQDTRRLQKYGSHP